VSARVSADTARHLLVVYQSRSGGTESMANAAIAGATSDDIDDVEVRVLRAFDAAADDVRWCDGLLLGTPENFGYMSGAIKDFFERIYYELLDETRGLPYTLFVKGGHDGEGAVRSIERIATGLVWKAVLPPVIVVGDIDDDALARCTELGLTFAAGLEAGVF
jgi:multimeric flavodoxin WrbA